MPQDLEGAKGPDLKLRALISVMVLILETGIILGGHYYLNQQTEKKIKEGEALRQEFELGKVAADKQEKEMRDALVFVRQITAASEALDQHIYTSRGFDFIEANTLDGISYTRMLIDVTNSTVTLDVSAPRYRAMAEQIVKFGELEQVLQVRNTAVALKGAAEQSNQGVLSVITLKLKPTVWLYPKTSPEAGQK